MAHAVTAAVVSEPIAASPAVSPVNLASTQNYIVYGVVAIIILIIIIGALIAVLMLRTRP